MHLQQNIQTASSRIQKQDSKLIDAQKIKTILSKKLQKKTLNPEQIVQELDQQISYQIEKTQHQIEKERQRKDRIHMIEQRQMKARSMLNEKILSKLQKSNKKKTNQQKKWIDDRLKERKLKQQIFSERKQQMIQNQFKTRLQKFKQIKALNDPKLQSQKQQLPKNKRVSLLRRSLSERSSFGNALEKSKEIEDLNYFKRMQLLEKRKIYEKIEPKVSFPKANEKSDWIQKLNSQSESKFIQKLGNDLVKIQQARKKRNKQTSQRLQKIRKQAEIREEQRESRLETLKDGMNQIQKNRKEVLSKKNERFLSVRNKSTPSLLDRNASWASQNRDTFGGSMSGRFLGNTSKMSKTMQNFNQSISVDRAKAQDYLVKQKQKKIKRHAMNVIAQVLREQKTELLMK